MYLGVSLLATLAFNLIELVKETKCDLFPKIKTKKLRFKYLRLKTKITNK